MSRTVVVTGSNRGIGLELCKRFLEAGDKVYATCRAASEELKGTGAEIIEGLDVANAETYSKLSSIPERIDVLVNNAGIWRTETIDHFNVCTMQEQMNVNCFGPLALSQHLLDKMSTGGKIAFITSRMGSIADNTSGGRYGYRMSKTALNSGAYSMAMDVKPREIAIAILHPGFVRTDMTDGRGDWGPDESSQCLKDRIDELSLDTSGKFLHAKGEELPW